KNVLVAGAWLRIDAKHLKLLIEEAPNVRILGHEDAFDPPGYRIPKQHLWILRAGNGSPFEPSPQAPPRILAIGADDRLSNAPRFGMKLFLIQPNGVRLDRILHDVPISQMLAKMPQCARLGCQNERLFAARQVAVDSFGHLPKQRVEQDIFIIFGAHAERMELAVIASARRIAAVAGMKAELIVIFRALPDFRHAARHALDFDLNELTLASPIEPDLLARDCEQIEILAVPEHRNHRTQMIPWTDDNELRNRPGQFHPMRFSLLDTHCAAVLL